MKIFKQKDIVTKLLNEYPELRDNDSRLVANVWLHELQGLELNHNKISAGKFLHLYATGQLTASDSITRLRRKLQEENIELRGEKYNKRQNRVTNVQMELGYATKRK